MPTTLSELRALADKTGAEFEEIAKRHYAQGKWDFYRACDRGDSIPEEVVAAHQTSVKALHEYYGARDGEHGFLGSRGL